VIGVGEQATTDEVLAQLRGRVWLELVQFAALAVVAGVAVAAAVSGRFVDVPGPLWWLLAGAVGMDAVNTAGRLVVAVRFLVRARRDATFLALSVLCVDAQHRLAQWQRAGVVVGPVEPSAAPPAGGGQVGA